MKSTLPSLTALTTTIQQETAVFRKLYAEKKSAFEKINEEMRYIHQAPADRQFIAEFLLDVIDRYADSFLGNVRNSLQVFSHNTSPDEVQIRRDGWYQGLKSNLEPPYWFLVPLLKQQLRDGVARLAQEIEWPHTDVVTATREQRLKDLQAQQSALADEMDALRAEVAKVGVEL